MSVPTHDVTEPPRSRPTVTGDTRRLQPTHRRLGRLSLRVTEGPDRGRDFSLSIDRHRPVRGGRGRHNDIVLTDDSVSSEHFDLRIDSTALVLRDLESTNGIRIGGALVREASIFPTTRFRVGDSELELISADSVEVSLWPEIHFEGMYGRSPLMRELFSQLDNLARKAGQLRYVPILLVGPTGTGKELAARAIHARSSRNREPFITVDCAAISGGLAEAFESARGGTLFLDEIGELAPDLQARLLRPLEQAELLRCDVRVVATSHHNLVKRVEQGRFRDDLFYRLQGIYLELPSLRERGDDVLLLAERFLESLAGDTGVRLRLADEAKGPLRVELWPGNVRQLQRVIQRAAMVATGAEIRRKDLALEVTGLLGATLEMERLFNMPVRDAQDEFQRSYYRRLLTRFRTRGEAAKFAGVTSEGLRQACIRLGMRDTDEPKG
jgi:transcriptional regulator with GAF, ATPase, and Fis domain